MPRIEFKQYGHYRTGTNLVKVLVEHHLDRIVHSATLGNKHEGFNKQQFDIYNLNRAPHIKLLISIKNPYSWVVSFSRWTMKDGVYTDIDVPPLSEVSPDKIKRWCTSFNHLYAHWIELPYEHQVVRYEDLISNPKNCLDAIRLKWDLKYKSRPRNVEFIIRPGQEISYKRFDFSYYLENRYVLELADRQIDAIRSSIDWTLMSKLGYESTLPTYTPIIDYQI